MCKTEKQALEETISETGGCFEKPQRRLRQYSVVNTAGDIIPLQQIGLTDHAACFLTGAVMTVHHERPDELLLRPPNTGECFAGSIFPIKGKLDKDAGRKTRAKIGPVMHWAPVYTGNEPAIKVQTALAEYTILTPSTQYKAQHADAMEQVSLCFAILQTMKTKGTDAETQSFETTLSAVNRAKAVKGYVSVRDAVLLNGSFILSQLPQMQAVMKSGLCLEKSTFFLELKSEVWPACVAK